MFFEYLYNEYLFKYFTLEERVHFVDTFLECLPRAWAKCITLDLPSETNIFNINEISYAYANILHLRLRTVRHILGSKDNWVQTFM